MHRVLAVASRSGTHATPHTRPARPTPASHNSLCSQAVQQLGVDVASNPGAKLLARMGFGTSGSGLGRHQQGIAAPIDPVAIKVRAYLHGLIEGMACWLWFARVLGSTPWPSRRELGLMQHRAWCYRAGA